MFVVISDKPGKGWPRQTRSAAFGLASHGQISPTLIRCPRLLGPILNDTAHALHETNQRRYAPNRRSSTNGDLDALSTSDLRARETVSERETQEERYDKSSPRECGPRCRRRGETGGRRQRWPLPGAEQVDRAESTSERNSVSLDSIVCTRSETYTGNGTSGSGSLGLGDAESDLLSSNLHGRLSLSRGETRLNVTVREEGQSIAGRAKESGRVRRRLLGKEDRPTHPNAAVLQRMPNAPHSLATVLVSPTTPAFAVA